MQKRIAIAEEVMLPSRGEIYEESVNPNIVMSSMTTKHEMLRLSATTGASKIMASIIDDCMQEPCGISSYDMCLGDFQYLLYRLRMATYGSDYSMTSTCPVCGFEHRDDINLDELEVKEYDEDLADLLELKLEMSNVVVRLTLQTPRMLDTINKQTKDYMKKHRSDNSNPTLLYTIVDSIVEVDGEQWNSIRLEDFIKNLPMKDTNELIKRIDEINAYMGVDTNIQSDCPLCGKEYIIPFQSDVGFWRP